MSAFCCGSEQLSRRVAEDSRFPGCWGYDLGDSISGKPLVGNMQLHLASIQPVPLGLLVLSREGSRKPQGMVYKGHSLIPTEHQQVRQF